MSAPADKRMIGLLAIAVASLALFGAGVLADRLWMSWTLRHQRVELSIKPQLRATYQHRVTHFERLKSRPSVVMLGDSITQWGEWSELLGPQVANRGIGGDTSGALLARLDRSVPSSARTVVIMIGGNDLKDPEWTVEKTVGNVGAILDRLEERRVILQTVLPTSDATNNAKVRRLNPELRRICGERSHCEWLEVDRAIAPSGTLGKDVTADGGHLNGLGLERWAETLKPVLAKPHP